MATKPAPNLRLQRARFEQQMTRAELSRLTGISRKSLLDVEKRKVRPRLDTAARVALALKGEITDYFDESEVIG